MVLVAVVGTGSMGMRHLWYFRQIADVGVVAVPKRGHRVTELGNQGLVVVNDVGEAARMGATMCVIASSTGQHVKDSLEALDSGMDLLVEKPLATDASEAQRVSRRAKDTGRRVFVGCVMRFSESLNRFQKMLHQVGRLHSVRIEAQSYLPDWQPERPYKESFRGRRGEGGVLLDLVHEVDYAGWLFGWPVAVRGRVRNLGRLGISADEVAELSWEAQDGCAVSVSLDFLTRPPRRKMRAHGELGTIEWDGVEGTVIITSPSSPPYVERSSQRRDEMFLEQAQAFVGALGGIHDSRLATCEEGVKVMAVCDTARRSSGSEHAETVEYP